MQKSFPLLTLMAFILLTVPTALSAEDRKPALSTPVTYIELTGPGSLAKAELSGLAWHGDQLVLLPQYPGRFVQDGKGSLFSIPKTRILSYLEGADTDPVRPDPIPIDMDSIRKNVEEIAGRGSFQGFEAIAIVGDMVYLSTEAEKGGRLYGFLVQGRFQEGTKGIVLDRQSLVPVPLPVQIHNKTYEAMFVAQNRLIAIFEANGVRDNPAPKTQVFEVGHPEKKPRYLGDSPFSHIEYRITDITAWDETRPLAAINYYFPGDIKYLSPQPDPGRPVERLVALSYDGSTLALMDVPALELINKDPDKPRNWEGIVRLDKRGFLLVTDKWPQTILGFAPDLWQGN